MAHPQKEPLRPLSKPEERELQRLAKASSERLDVVRRAKALLAVAGGQTFTQAAHAAGLKSGDGVGKLVKRFNVHGLSALSIAAGRGRKPTYTHEQRSQMVAELQREPKRKEDATATWSLSLLQQRLRATNLPAVGASTIRRTLHQAGYVFGQTRTWCQTGTVQRKRKGGVVSVHDPKTEEKKE